jgi:hypothetical protein
MKKAVLAAVAVLLLLAVSACGSDSSDKPKLTAEEKKIAANIAKSFSADSSGALNAAEAKCFADDFVGTVGAKKLKAAKLIDAKGALNQSEAKFDKALATDFAESFLGCVDYQKKQAQVIAKSDAKIDAAKLEACLAKEMPESYVTKLIVSSYTQTTESTTLLNESTKKLESCKTEATAKN